MGSQLQSTDTYGEIQAVAPATIQVQILIDSSPQQPELLRIQTVAGVRPLAGSSAA
jgi:hypothetical protein